VLHRPLGVLSPGHDNANGYRIWNFGHKPDVGSPQPARIDLQAAINRYIAEHNMPPKPFTWTITPGQILAKLNPLNAPVH
jgi:hypothetical protein